MTNRNAGLFTLALFAIASVVGIGCSSSVGPQSSIPATGGAPGAPNKHHHRGKPGAYGDFISHVFIIIQENRSLNDLFAGSGISGANTTLTGTEWTSSGPVTIPLTKTHLNVSQDIGHCYVDAATAIDGGAMDRFNWEYSQVQAPCPAVSAKPDERTGDYPYSYVNPNDITSYIDIANNWVLAANFFPTEIGPSFVAHLNLIASTTEYKHNVAVANYPPSLPWGCDNKQYPAMQLLSPTHTPGPSTGPEPCYNQFHTMADLLDGQRASGQIATKVQWRYYAPPYKTGANGYIWSAFDAISRIRNGSEWTTNVKSPQTQILNDIPNGNLDNVGVVWVVPDCDHSDHASCAKDEGPAWVADVVNAIGTRQKLWNNSVIVVLWDDWGGWYDNVAPPSLGFRGLGIRTPMLILSPYDKQGPGSYAGHVSLRQFESGSILKFIEQVFNLPPLESLPCDGYGSGYGSGPSSTGCGLGYTDQTDSGTTVNSIGDVLDFSQSPRSFQTIPSSCSASCIQSETLPTGPPDDE